ncbi:MAG TPA: ATP-dependent RNA helicase DbpA [Kofleriaceae bacterium]|nr:ATP-dependent RNA helicase DbpA [Kofleriaceae bacterium]
MSSGFDALSLSPSLLAVVGELGYVDPTPIQTASIPALLARKDLIGQSKTGSGKTAAFALAILQNLRLEPRSLQALVVCPTRELSAQVAREFRKLGRRHEGLQVLVVAGGEPIRPQVGALERGVHIAVGTPGRLLDHVERGSLDPGAVDTVVLDEADRMLDMGFQKDMETILRALPASRQTVFFSATFPDMIEAMSRTHQRDAVRVTIDEPAQAMPEIRQVALTAEADDKLEALYWALGEYPHESALIFCNFKATVAELARTLAAASLSVDCLHGDLEQFHRDQVLARFRNHSLRILIATDVAARGIDVEDLDLVINYELPAQPEIYVHRIGRTGRAGKLGVSVSLATSREKTRLQEIERLTGTPIERVRHDAGSDPTALARPSRMDTILISGGRKDKVRPGDILGALTGEAGGLSAADVGKIEIHDGFSYVAVSKRVSRAAVKSINAGRIKAKRFRASLV